MCSFLREMDAPEDQSYYLALAAAMDGDRVATRRHFRYSVRQKDLLADVEGAMPLARETMAAAAACSTMTLKRRDDLFHHCIDQETPRVLEAFWMALSPDSPRPVCGCAARICSLPFVAALDAARLFTAHELDALKIALTVRYDVVDDASWNALAPIFSSLLSEGMTHQGPPQLRQMYLKFSAGDWGTQTQDLVAVIDGALTRAQIRLRVGEIAWQRRKHAVRAHRERHEAAMRREPPLVIGVAPPPQPPRAPIELDLTLENEIIEVE